MSYFRIIVSLALICILSGCTCTQVLRDRANQPHCRFANMTRVNRAVLIDRNIFVELEVRKDNQPTLENVVLEIPLDDPAWVEKAWPQDVTLQHVSPFPLPESFLKKVESFPNEGIVLPVQEMELHDIDHVRNAAINLGRGIHILAITFFPDDIYKGYYKAMYGKAPPSSILLIGILEITNDSNNFNPLIILGFIEECKEYKAWYTLLPFAFAVDVVTFPIQLIAVLLFGY